MARRPKPWYRKDRKAWFVTIRGTRHNLGPDKSTAFDLFHELMAQPEEVVAVSNSLLSLLDRFLEWTKNNRAIRTYEWYLERLQWFTDFLAADLSTTDLKPFHVQEWLDSKDCSDGHKRGCLKAVDRALNWAVQMGYIDKNPVAGMEKPSGSRRELVITHEVYQRILKLSSDQEFKDLVIVCWETGCRPKRLSVWKPVMWTYLTNDGVFRLTNRKAGRKSAWFI